MHIDGGRKGLAQEDSNPFEQPTTSDESDEVQKATNFNLQALFGPDNRVGSMAFKQLVNLGSKILSPVLLALAEHDFDLVGPRGDVRALRASAVVREVTGADPSDALLALIADPERSFKEKLGAIKIILFSDLHPIGDRFLIENLSSFAPLFQERLVQLLTPQSNARELLSAIKCVELIYKAAENLRPTDGGGAIGVEEGRVRAAFAELIAPLATFHLTHRGLSLQDHGVPQLRKQHQIEREAVRIIGPLIWLLAPTSTEAQAVFKQSVGQSELQAAISQSLTELASPQIQMMQPVLIIAILRCDRPFGPHENARNELAGLLQKLIALNPHPKLEQALGVLYSQAIDKKIISLFSSLISSLGDDALDSTTALRGKFASRLSRIVKMLNEILWPLNEERKLWDFRELVDKLKFLQERH